MASLFRSSLVITISGILLLMSSCESISLLLQGDRPARFRRDGNTLYMQGVLGKTAYRRLKRQLDNKRLTDTPVFVQSDGSENDDYNLMTARLIRQHHLATKLLPTSSIASGAVDLFLAGTSRIIPAGARLGIHSWRTDKREGKDFPRDDENHEMFWKYYQEIGVDTYFLAHIIHCSRQ